ncbi:hypothetical protein G4D82_02060 [Flavobacterium sp. CYK-4]|uniref:tetratricopeptide repeat-containing sensor histidine kinase n=1 Tax=Flavobacterium lotistagni TaxID=2709660 RepID=UPI00140D406D|nr:ATP-binding protein [Flavobacterium lotistagni]NHM05992.1 hypothetical protein [Flavobacterium lotistagni]
MKKIILFILFFIALFSCKKTPPGHYYADKKIDDLIDKAANLDLDADTRNKCNVIALNQLIDSKNDSLNCLRLVKVAKNFGTLNEWKNLRVTAETILERSTRNHNQYFIGQSYRYLGYYYENRSINDSAFYFFSKAEKIYASLKNFKETCKIHIDKCLLQYYTNDYLGSEVSAIKALKIAKNNNLIESEYDAYIYLYMNSIQLQDFLSAIEYGKKSLQLIQKHSAFFRPQDIAFSLRVIGCSYFSVGKTNEALKYYEMALDKKLCCHRYSVTYTGLLDNYALALFQLQRFNKVEKLHLRAAKIRDSLNIDQGKNMNKIFLSEYYFQTNQKEKAKSYANRALSLSKEFCSPNDVLFSLKQLSKVDPKNALKYSQEYIRISDSMQQLERETRNKFAKIAYETDEIIKEKQSAEKKNRIISATASGLILVLVLLLIIILQRAKQKRLELEQVQQKANEEIYNLLLDKQNKIDRGRRIEKKRIAQDLHDSVLNRLASTRLNLHNIAENPDAQKLQKCLPFIDGIQDIEKEIRNIAHDLNRGAFSNAISFLEIIESFIEDQQTLSNRKQHLEIDPAIDWELLSSNKKIHIFRILQEAFQNINKHSGAKSVMVSLLKRDEHILLEIFDDGDGFSFNEKKKGIGLQNIFSRAHSCGGSAQVKSRVHEGTTVIVKIPL